MQMNDVRKKNLQIPEALGSMAAYYNPYGFSHERFMWIT